MRLLRRYYSTEKPLPADIKECQRLVSAHTKNEKNSVEKILREFFILKDDGWHNQRADEEISKFNTLSNRMKANAIKRWNKNTLHDKPMQLHSNGNANGMQKQSDSDAIGMHPITHYPLPNNINPPLSPLSGDKSGDDDDDDDEKKLKPGHVCAMMRGYGINANPQNPEIRFLVSQGVGMDVFTEACQRAKRAKANQSINAGYVVAIVKNMLKEQEQQSQAPVNGKDFTVINGEVKPWYESDSMIKKRGDEIGIPRREGEIGIQHLRRILRKLEETDGFESVRPIYEKTRITYDGAAYV